MHLTGRGRRGAPELPLVTALGVADRDARRAKRADAGRPWGRADQRWSGTARLVSSAPGLAPAVSVGDRRRAGGRSRPAEHDLKVPFPLVMAYRMARAGLRRVPRGLLRACFRCCG